jgi:HSP20 family protein
MRTLVKSNNNYYNELPSIFDDFTLLGDLFRKGVSRPVNSLPSVNVKETEAAYELEIAAPGLSKEDFKIDVEGETLIISAEKETSKEEKEESYTRKEFSYSSFKRSFNLPERAIETDKITAKYVDGILQLVVPKLEKVNNQKRITVA